MLNLSYVENTLLEQPERNLSDELNEAIQGCIERGSIAREGGLLALTEVSKAQIEEAIHQYQSDEEDFDEAPARLFHLVPVNCLRVKLQPNSGLVRNLQVTILNLRRFLVYGIPPGHILNNKTIRNSGN